MQGSPTAATRGSREVRHPKFLKRCDFFGTKTVLVLEIIKICEAVLEGNPPGQGDAKEILVGVRSELLPTRSVFTDEYFVSSSFPVVLLEATMDLYDASFTVNVLPDLGPSFEDGKNKGLVAQIWLAELLECDVETIRDVVHKYLFNHESANPLRHGRTPRPLGLDTSLLGSRVGRFATRTPC